MINCKSIVPCPFGTMCEKLGRCPGEGNKHLRFVKTGKAILVAVDGESKYYEDDMIDMFTGEHMARYEDKCTNEMFGESDNYCYIEPLLVNGKYVVIDWDSLD